jgi:hypothetical protein
VLIRRRVVEPSAGVPDYNAIVEVEPVGASEMAVAADRQEAQ